MRVLPSYEHRRALSSTPCRGVVEYNSIGAWLDSLFFFRSIRDRTVSSKLHIFENRGSTNPSTRRHNRRTFPPLLEYPSEPQTKVLA
jgi:hypothetical protein